MIAAAVPISASFLMSWVLVTPPAAMMGESTVSTRDFVLSMFGPASIPSFVMSV